MTTATSVGPPAAVAFDEGYDLIAVNEAPVPRHSAHVPPQCVPVLELTANERAHPCRLEPVNTTSAAVVLTEFNVVRERDLFVVGLDADRRCHYRVRAKMPELFQTMVNVPAVTLFAPPK